MTIPLAHKPTITSDKHRKRGNHHLLHWLSCGLFILLSLSSTLWADNHTATNSAAVGGGATTEITAAPAQAADNKSQTAAETTHAKTGSTETEATEAGHAEGEHSIESSMADLEAIQRTLEAMSRELENSKEKSSFNSSSMQTIKDGLGLIEDKLKHAYDGLDESRGSISVNSGNIEKVHKELLESTREMRANTADLDIQKSLIEDNSIRLYEMLIRLSNTREKVNQLADSLLNARNSANEQEVKPLVLADLAQLWRFLSIVLTLLAPAAYLLTSALQNNPVSPTTRPGEAFVICMVAFLGYFFIGFSLMYGTTSGGLFGIDSHLFTTQAQASHPDVATDDTNTLEITPYIIGFLLYQSGFILLGALIVAAAVGRYLSGFATLLLAFIVGAVVLPVFGHWSWAGYLTATNKGWLESSGFIDQSGSVVIHTVAAWYALTLALKLSSSSDQPGNTMEDSAPLYAAPAVFLLWIGWMGFTVGNLPATSTQIPLALLNISLAATTAAAVAFMHYAFFHNEPDRIMQMTYGGFVSGLVAIAACVLLVTPLEAVVIGAIAGIIQNMAFSLLRRLLFRQHWQITTAQLIAVHGITSLWGALCVALFGTENTFAAPNMLQMFSQLKGMAAAIIYSIVAAQITLLLLAFTRKRQQQKQNAKQNA